MIWIVKMIPFYQWVKNMWKLNVGNLVSLNRSISAKLSLKSL